MDMETIARLARHFVAVIIAFLIGKGYLPVDLSGPVTELAIALLTAMTAAYLGQVSAKKTRVKK